MSVTMVVLWFLAGAATEVVNTLTRKWTVERMQDVHSVGWIVGGLLLRLVGTATVLVLAFRYGVAEGVAALMGYMASRWAMIWWLNRQLERGADS